MSAVMSVQLTRTELVALREMIELTPLFEGRSEARNAIRELLHATRPEPLSLEESLFSDLARRVIPIDVPSAALRSKLVRALQRERPAPAAPSRLGVAIVRPA